MNKQTEELLMVWDFLCSFHQTLGLLPLPFPDYFLAVTIMNMVVRVWLVGW